MERASKSLISTLRKQKHENKSLLFLDNVKIIKDAIASGNLKCDFLLTSLQEIPFDCKGAKVLYADEKTIASLADTKTPQKVLCVGSLKQCSIHVPTQNFLVLDSLQDPGNVGTLIRTAKACGFESVFLLDCVKVTNSKLVRSSVGAVFDMQLFEMSKPQFVEFSTKNKLNLICCDMQGENIFNFKNSQNVGVVVGSEGQGVSKEIQNLCFKTVKIPMAEGIESLNAGVSGSIVMYQISKDKLANL